MGRCLPFFGVDGGNAKQHQEMLSFLSGISGEEVSVKAERLVSAIAAVSASQKLSLSIEEIIYTPLPANININKATQASVGISVNSDGSLNPSIAFSRTDGDKKVSFLLDRNFFEGLEIIADWVEKGIENFKTKPETLESKIQSEALQLKQELIQKHGLNEGEANKIILNALQTVAKDAEYQLKFGGDVEIKPAALPLIIVAIEGISACAANPACAGAVILAIGIMTKLVVGHTQEYYYQAEDDQGNVVWLKKSGNNNLPVTTNHKEGPASGGDPENHDPNKELKEKLTIEVVREIANKIDLRDYEEQHYDGHSIQKHIAKDKEWLADRYQKEGILPNRLRGIPAATSFEDISSANRFVKETIKQNAKEIVEWFNNSNKNRMPFETKFNEVVGHGIKKGELNLEYFYKVRVLLDKTNGNINVVTSFPVE